MSSIYVSRDGSQFGPFDEAQIFAMIGEQKILGSDLIWKEGMPTWATASDVLTPFSAREVVAPPPLPRPEPVTPKSIASNSPGRHGEALPHSNPDARAAVHREHGAIDHSSAIASSVFDRLSQPATLSLPQQSETQSPSYRLPPVSSPVNPASPAVENSPANFDGKKPLSKSWQRKFAIYDGAGGYSPRKLIILEGRIF